MSVHSIGATTSSHPNRRRYSRKASCCPICCQCSCFGWSCGKKRRLNSFLLLSRQSTENFEDARDHTTSSSQSAYQGGGGNDVDDDFFDCYEEDYPYEDYYHHYHDEDEDVLCHHIAWQTRDETQFQEQSPQLEAALQYMLSSLTEAQLETAAKMSYPYFQMTGEQQQQQLQLPTAIFTMDRKEMRTIHAKKMAQRYLLSKKQVPKALQFMKQTLAFRDKINVDRLRTIFDDNQPTNTTAESESNYNESDNNFNESDRIKLESMLASKKNYVMGYDKQGRSTFMFVPRQTQQHDAKWTILESLYTMERALACTRSPDGSINAVVDFAGFDWTKQAPPLSIGRDFLTTLRNHYVGCFHKIFLLDAPSGFTILWNIFQPFVGTNTRQKIVFVSGAKEKNVVLADYYTLQQAAPFMLDGGQKTRELDLQEYLFETPFDQAFGDRHD